MEKFTFKDLWEMTEFMTPKVIPGFENITLHQWRGI